MSSIPADAGASKNDVEQVALPAKAEETKAATVEEVEEAADYDGDDDVPDPDEDDLDDLDGKLRLRAP